MSLTENIVESIAENTILASWCTTNYSQAHLVQSGIDLDYLPEQDDYPIVMVAKVSSREGKALDTESAEYVVTCGLVDGSAPVTVGKTRSYGQVSKLEDFRLLVLAAIEAADLAGGYVAEVNVENDPVELFPIWSTNMIIRIQCPTAMRGRWAI